MTTRELLGCDDKWAMIIGIPIVGLLLSGIFFASQPNQPLSSFWTIYYPISLCYTTSFWLGFRYIIISVRRNDDLRNNTRKRLIVETLLVLVGFTLINLTLDWLFDLLAPNPANDDANLVELFSSLIISFFILALYEIQFIQRQLERTVLERELLSKANMQSQLEGLKNQIQPHFLFNSLNALAGLIPHDSRRAVRYVNKLSEVFRYLLEIDDTPLISLEEELAFLQSFVYLQEERFGENLIVKIGIDPIHYGKMVVPLSLQILFENVIKHNILSHTRPLHVRIFINTQGKITVENNLQPKDLPPSSTGIGLENIKKRYAFIGEETVDILASESAFSVSLPLVQMPESIVSI